MFNKLRVLGLSVALVLSSACFVVPSTYASCPCVAPNVGGTVALMPVTCTTGYVGFMQITDGLPVGTTIDCQAELGGFYLTSEAVGGTLGGYIQTWSAYLHLEMTGTGALAGFNRSLQIPVSGLTNSAPRTFGDAVQSFAHNLMTLDGQLVGDPDFENLAVKAGPNESLPPSPGYTSLTRVGPPGSDFQVDSFFDVTYTLDFTGAPGSVLDGLSGITQDAQRLQLCDNPVPVQNATWGLIKTLYRF